MFEPRQVGYLEALERMRFLLVRIRENRTIPGHAGRVNGDSMSFDSMVISNTNLSIVWKLHYLKQSLKGTATYLLKNTALTF